MSDLESYNEMCVDLLVPTAAASRALEIKEHPQLGVHVKAADKAAADTAAKAKAETDKFLTSQEVILYKESKGSKLGVGFYPRDPQEGGVPEAAIIRQVDATGPAAGKLFIGERIMSVQGQDVQGPQHAERLLSELEGYMMIKKLPTRASAMAAAALYAKEAEEAPVKNFRGPCADCCKPLAPCCCVSADGEAIFGCVLTEPKYFLPACLHMALCPQLGCDPRGGNEEWDYCCAPLTVTLVSTLFVNCIQGDIQGDGKGAIW